MICFCTFVILKLKTMKKTIILFLGLMFVLTLSDAQIDIKSKVKEKNESTN